MFFCICLCPEELQADSRPRSHDPQETTTRRPRKVRRTDPGPVASTSTAAAGTATIQPRLRRLRRAVSSSSDDPNEPAPGVDLFASQSDTESDDDLSFGRVLEPMGIRAQLAADERAARFGIVEAAATPTGSTMSPPRDDRRLAVPDRTDGTEYTLYNQLHAIRGAPVRGVVPFEQLWNLLLVDEPFPANANTVDSFIAALNDTAWHYAPIAAVDLFALLREIIRCDPAILARADEASRARTRAMRPPGSEQRSARQHFGWLMQPGAHGFGPRSIRPLNSNPFALGPSSTGRAAPDGESRRDGIWRTTFVEHIGDGQARDVEVDFDAGESATEAFSFADFAQQRRAERRSDASETSRSQPGVVRVTAVEAARSRASATGDAPSFGATSVSPPEPSQAPAPPPAEGACPAPAADRRTSASIAEAHARSQRRVVPLRSGAASDADLSLSAAPSPALLAAPAPTGGVLVEQVGEPSGTESMRAVVEALHRARSRRVRSTAPEATHGGLSAAAGGAGEQDEDVSVVEQTR